MCGGSDPKPVPESDEERSLAEIAVERFVRYRDKYVPVENIAIDKTTDYLEDPGDFGAGQANLATQTQYSALEPKLTTGLTLRGAKAGSGAFTGGVTGLVRDRTRSSAMGQVGTDIYERAQGIHNIGQLIRLGQGQATEGLQGMTASADAASRQAIMDAQASAAARSAMRQFIGTGVGMASASYFNSPNEELPDRVSQSSGGINPTGRGMIVGP